MCVCVQTPSAITHKDTEIPYRQRTKAHHPKYLGLRHHYTTTVPLGEMEQQKSTKNRASSNKMILCKAHVKVTLRNGKCTQTATKNKQEKKKKKLEDWRRLEEKRISHGTGSCRVVSSEVLTSVLLHESKKERESSRAARVYPQQ